MNVVSNLKGQRGGRPQPGLGHTQLECLMCISLSGVSSINWIIQLPQPASLSLYGPSLSYVPTCFCVFFG